MSESVLDGDYPITGIQTTTKITEQMIQESYGAAVEWIRNADVPTHLTDEQLQVFLRKLAELCGKAEQADAAIAAMNAEDRREIDAAGGYHEYMERFADGEPDAD